MITDVEAIAHVASPVGFSSDDPIRYVVNPAVNGKLSLLSPAKTYGKLVKHVIVTLSVANILNYEVEPGYNYTEKAGITVVSSCV